MKKASLLVFVASWLLVFSVPRYAQSDISALDSITSVAAILDLNKGEVAGKCELERGVAEVWFNCQATKLKKNHAYTVWFRIDQGDDESEEFVFLGAGGFTDGKGAGEFEGHIPVPSDIPLRDDGETVRKPRGEDPTRFFDNNARVTIEWRDHGKTDKKEPDKAIEQISGFSGGCDEFDCGTTHRATLPPLDPAPPPAM